MFANQDSTPAGVPRHVLKRARRPYGFSTNEDFEVYRLALVAAGFKYRCAVHAYVLMQDHVHLLVTPETRKGISRMMQSVERRYGRYLRYRYRVKESVWEDGIQVWALNAVESLRDCHRFVESNPVRIVLTDRPEAWPWSSYRHNALGFDDPLVRPTDWYNQLGTDDAERQAAYRRIFGQPARTPSPGRKGQSVLDQPGLCGNAIA